MPVFRYKDTVEICKFLLNVIDQEENEKLLLATQSTELLNFVREFRNV